MIRICATAAPLEAALSPISHASLCQHAGNIECIVTAANHRDVPPWIAVRITRPGRSDMHAPLLRHPPRILDAAEPVFTFKSCSGGDHHRRCGQNLRGLRSGDGDMQLETALGTTLEPIWSCIQPGFDRHLPDMPGEGLCVLAGGFIRPSEQPFIGIGAAFGHSAEDALLFDDDRAERVIAKPKRAGHPCGASANHGYSGDGAKHCFYTWD